MFFIFEENGYGVRRQKNRRGAKMVIANYNIMYVQIRNDISYIQYCNTREAQRPYAVSHKLQL